MHYVIPVLMGTPGGQGGTEGFFVSLLPIAAMVAILWFLLIRPQQKETGWLRWVVFTAASCRSTKRRSL